MCLRLQKKKPRLSPRFFCMLGEHYVSEMPRASADHGYAFLVLSQHYPEAAAARIRKGWQLSSGEGSHIPLINQLTANHGEQDRRIQDVLLGDCHQVLIEDGEIRQLPDLD